MHVAVIGAGVTGIATAHYVRKLGHSVTVFEQQDSVASGTSFANAGQLAYSYVDSLASPEFAAQIPRILAGRDRSSVFDRRAGIEFLGWGLRFLVQCTPRRATRNMLALLGPAMRSAENLAVLRKEAEFDFDFRSHGKLVLLRKAQEIEKAHRSADLKRQHGCDTEIISIDHAVSLEPSIASMNGEYKAAIYAAGDHLGNAQKFAIGLSEWLHQSEGVELRMREAVKGFRIENRRVVAISTIDGEYPADAAIACTGVWSDELLGPLGIRCRICPIRGYSMTLPPASATPTLSVTDPKRRVVFSRLGDTVRIAGLADFVGFDTSRDRARCEFLLEVAKNTAPLAANYAARRRHRWGGFRPMTPDGIPLVGATRIGGLFVNTGHGALGWTLALATAEEVANCVSKSTIKGEP